MQPNPKPPVVLAQVGGAHGALSWGMLDRLLEDDRIEVPSISGTSAGAMNSGHGRWAPASRPPRRTRRARRLLEGGQ